MAGMVLIARFQALPERREELRAALAEIAPPTRAEPGCISFEVLTSNHEPGLFFIHSRWQDVAAFDRHAGLAHTRRFLDVAAACIGHPLDTQRLFIEI
jgi:quinol monooxygenase YgiN